MRDKGETRLAIEAMARAGGAGLRELTGRRAAGMPPCPKGKTSCRCTMDVATDCDGGGVAPRADGACGCPCHGGAEATDAIVAMANDETISPKIREIFATSHEPPIVDVLSRCSMCEEYAKAHEKYLAITRDALKQAKEAEAALEPTHADLRRVTAEYNALRAIVEEYVVAERELKKFDPHHRTHTEEGIAATVRVLCAEARLRASLEVFRG